MRRRCVRNLQRSIGIREVPLDSDAGHRPICPKCRCPLQRLRRRRRIVEDLIPSAVEVTCYHTQGGYCPHCRHNVESRAPQQPPRGERATRSTGHQRIDHRGDPAGAASIAVPSDRSTAPKDLPGLNLSPAGYRQQQIKRIARWLDGKYQDLILQMRASPHVHADETGWRIDGKNFWLWAFTDPTFTLYHVDESRGGKKYR